MFRSFQEIEEYVLSNHIKKTIALCGAHDEPALSAVVHARKKGVADAILIGDTPKVKEILTNLGESLSDYTYIDETDESEAAAKAIALVKSGKAHMPMKGLMQSSSYLRAILNKETGILPEGKVLSESTPFEYPDGNRMMIVTDCAMNIQPTVEQKVEIVKNAVDLARAFRKEGEIKVACLSPLEKVNPKIQSTVDAAEVASKDWPEGILVEGPFALDNAVSEEAAKHKGIDSKVAGQADILLCSDLGMGNVIHKSIHFFAHLPSAGAMCGTEYPVIFTSRTDSSETKYYSILTAILQSM